MKYITYLTFLFIACTSFECQKVNQEQLIGIWLVSEFNVNGYNKTESINFPHEQWVEIKADGTFISGSYKIENRGTWRRKGNRNVIELVGEHKDWCNSVWRVEAISNVLVFKGKKELGTYAVNVILQRRDKLPIAKQYITKPSDRLVGFWEVDRLIHENQEVDNDGIWFRLRKGGNFASGDASGELFNGGFKYSTQDSTITFKKPKSDSVNKWKVAFDGNFKLVLTHSINSAEMHLKRVREFAFE